MGSSLLYGPDRYVRPQRIRFSAVLAINRISILTSLVIDRVWLNFPL